MGPDWEELLAEYEARNPDAHKLLIEAHDQHPETTNLVLSHFGDIVSSLANFRMAPSYMETLFRSFADFFQLPSVIAVLADVEAGSVSDGRNGHDDR